MVCCFLLFASGSRFCWHCRVDHPCSEIPSEKKEVLGGRELEEGEKRDAGRPAVGTGTTSTVMLLVLMVVIAK